MMAVNMRGHYSFANISALNVYFSQLIPGSFVT